MATVYLAFDRRHGRRVALKVMNPAVVGALGEEVVREHGRISNIPIDEISLLGIEMGPSRIS